MAVASMLALVSCTSSGTTADASAVPVQTVAATTTTVVERPPETIATTTTALGPTIKGGVPVRVIATDDRGSAKVQATPFALRRRELPTIDLLPPPPDDGQFRSSISELDDATLARSTWEDDCPVPPEGLRYLIVSFVGFDGLPHTGELIVNAEYAEGIVGVFETLFNARFPIEEMRIVEDADTRPPQLADVNNTSSFVCRRVTGGRRFSEHAHGLALDINPFHNPYIKGPSVIPGLATSFGDRSWVRTGMIYPDSVAVRAFAAIGWEWGGDWNSLKDYQHFSHNGR